MQGNKVKQCKQIKKNWILGNIWFRFVGTVSNSSMRQYKQTIVLLVLARIHYLWTFLNLFITFKKSLRAAKISFTFAWCTCHKNYTAQGTFHESWYFLIRTLFYLIQDLFNKFGYWAPMKFTLRYRKGIWRTNQSSLIFQWILLFLQTFPYKLLSTESAVLRFTKDYL